MIRPFTCRGFEGNAWRWHPEEGLPEPPPNRMWTASVWVAGIQFKAQARNREAAKSRVRRKLDAVARAFRERGFR
jgi:hypothetical protein